MNDNLPGHTKGTFQHAADDIFKILCIFLASCFAMCAYLDHSVHNYREAAVLIGLCVATTLLFFNISFCTIEDKIKEENHKNI